MFVKKPTLGIIEFSCLDHSFPYLPFFYHSLPPQTTFLIFHFVTLTTSRCFSNIPKFFFILLLLPRQSIVLIVRFIVFTGLNYTFIIFLYIIDFAISEHVPIFFFNFTFTTLNYTFTIFHHIVTFTVLQNNLFSHGRYANTSATISSA